MSPRQRSSAHRPVVPRRGTRVGQRGPASRRGEPEKKGYVGCSVTCPECQRAAKFHPCQQRRLRTIHGGVRVRRAYYYCGRCHQSFIPYDEVLGLQDEVSPGLMPLVCLAGALPPFADAARDLLQRLSGVRLSASAVLRDTEAMGERLRAQQKGGRMVRPTQRGVGWTAPREGAQPAAYVGLDAFSVPMPGPGAGKAEHRMLYTALLYTPDEKHTRYLADFDLEPLAEQARSQARALGVAQVSQLIAITGGGNGLEEALQRNLAANLTTILDWHHAAEHVCGFAAVLHAKDEAARRAWAEGAKGILYEQGGEALLTHLQALELPPRVSGEIREELRKLIGYFENNRHRTDYPSYRQKGWDIGSGPTEAGCKIIGERRLRHALGGGRRRHGSGAAGAICQRRKLWDGFWAQPHQTAA